MNSLAFRFFVWLTALAAVAGAGLAIARDYPVSGTAFGVVFGADVVFLVIAPLVDDVVNSRRRP